MDYYKFYARRASSILYKFLKSRKWNGSFLLPANICPIVPAIFMKASVSFYFVDINENSLCMDETAAIEMLKRNTNIKGVLFVHTYGNPQSFTDFFNNVKEVNRDICIIDDCCLSKPSFTPTNSIADLQLYSSGYSKYVDIGWGGWAFSKTKNLDFLEEAQPYNENDYLAMIDLFKSSISAEKTFYYQDGNWLDHREPEIEWNRFKNRIEEELDTVKKHKREINEIYYKYLKPWAINSNFWNWRFSILTKYKKELMKVIFDNNHFVSSHYVSLVSIFGPGYAPNADLFGKQVINLFNDFRYDLEKAEQLAICIRDFLVANKN